jgi:hypothetical protein
MTILLPKLLVTLLLSISSAPKSDLDFGYVFGTAGYVYADPASEMKREPYVILAFASEDGHKYLVKANQSGDYLAVLSPGRYCVSAYSKEGSYLQLDKAQLICIEVQSKKYFELGIMLKAGGGNRDKGK